MVVSLLKLTIRLSLILAGLNSKSMARIFQVDLTISLPFSTIDSISMVAMMQIREFFLISIAWIHLRMFNASNGNELIIQLMGYLYV